MQTEKGKEITNWNFSELPNTIFCFVNHFLNRFEFFFIGTPGKMYFDLHYFFNTKVHSNQGSVAT